MHAPRPRTSAPYREPGWIWTAPKSARSRVSHRDDCLPPPYAGRPRPALARVVVTRNASPVRVRRRAACSDRRGTPGPGGTGAGRDRPAVGVTSVSFAPVAGWATFITLAPQDEKLPSSRSRAARRADTTCSRCRWRPVPKPLEPPIPRQWSLQRMQWRRIARESPRQRAAPRRVGLSRERSLAGRAPQRPAASVASGQDAGLTLLSSTILRRGREHRTHSGAAKRPGGPARRSGSGEAASPAPRVRAQAPAPAFYELQAR